jgi:hypothetical protein
MPYKETYLCMTWRHDPLPATAAPLTYPQYRTLLVLLVRSSHIPYSCDMHLALHVPYYTLFIYKFEFISRAAIK